MDSNRHDDTTLPATGWRKPGRCGPNGGNCVEVNRAARGAVGVRDSKNPGGEPLSFGTAGWAAFLATRR